MERPIIRYDSSLAEDVMKYLESIRTYKNIKPVSRHIIGPDETLEGFLIFHDGSLLFAAYVIYAIIMDQKNKRKLHLIKSGAKTDNCSVPVAEHLSRTQALSGLYSFISVIHHHFGEAKMVFNFITDSMCSARLYKSGIETTLRLGSNTRVQKEQLLHLSDSFGNSVITLYWVPSLVNLADCLTKVSRDPVKLTNSCKYREGVIRPGVHFLDLDEQFKKKNWYYTVRKGKAEFRDLKVEELETLGFEDKVRRRSQERKKLMKELMTGIEIEEDQEETISIGCVTCLSGPAECIDAQDMLTELYPKEAKDIIQDNIFIMNERDQELNYLNIGKINTRSMKKKMTKECSCNSGKPKCDDCKGKAEIYEIKIQNLAKRFTMEKLLFNSIPLFSKYEPVLPLLIPSEAYEKMINRDDMKFEKLLRLSLLGMLKILSKLDEEKLSQVRNLIAEVFSQLCLSAQKTNKIDRKK